MPPSDNSRDPAKGPAESKDERLAAALRENLKRRKTQARLKGNGAQENSAKDNRARQDEASAEAPESGQVSGKD